MKLFFKSYSILAPGAVAMLMALSPVQAEEICEQDAGCGLSGARGALSDQSLVYRRAGGLGGLPPLPEQGERELPRETLILWHLPDAEHAAAGVFSLYEGEVEHFQQALPEVRFESGRSLISDAYFEQISRVLDRLADRPNLRLEVIGHTDPQPLSVRTAALYTDNYGLGLARATEVADLLATGLGLPAEMIQVASRGPDEPIASNETAEGMAINRRVEVQVWYDEPAQQRMAASCAPGQVNANHALMPFRISIDGQPVGDHGAGSADQQRCVDVALAEHHLQLRYDNLSALPRLNIATAPRMAVPGQTQYFRGHSNYMHWVESAEVRIYGKRSRWGQPQLLETVTLDPLLNGQWQPTEDLPDELFYRLRVYDAQGRFDDTEQVPLRLTRGDYEADPEESRADLLAVIGGNRLQRHRIGVAGGTVKVNGQGVQPGYAVFVMGDPVPVDRQGRFATEQIIPRGDHSVEVAVLDADGHGRLYRRDLSLPESDWFTVAIADITVGQQKTRGPARLVTGQDRYYDDKLYVDGRLAFFTRGDFGEKYSLTASLDTREEPIDSLFSNFHEKSPQAFLRRMDSNRHWATFGDDSTLVETAPTQGKAYIRIEDGKSHLMWGNFDQRNLENELAQIDRGLYGAQARFQSDGFTAFGERRVQIEGFAAEPGTATAREEFLGSGGSLYYLRYQDIAAGSESLRVEVRDKNSGSVLSSQTLQYGLDYSIDALQGRILLNGPLSSVSQDESIVRNAPLAGHPTYLVVTYEYSPGFDRLDDLAFGGRASIWLNDSIRLGFTGAQQEHFGERQNLEGIDLRLRHDDRTWLALEAAQTKGSGIEQSRSFDGGFGFSTETLITSGRAQAGRVEGSVHLEEVGLPSDSQLTFYYEERDEGFSAPGRLTQEDTRLRGVAVTSALTDSTELSVRADESEQGTERSTQSAELGVSQALNDEWTLAAGYRTDDRQSPAANHNGRRDDLAVQLEFDPEDKPWLAHGFAQGTVYTDGNRRDNNRVGAGGEYSLNDRTRLSGEVSDGNLGLGFRAGIDYATSDRTNLYLNYERDSDRADQGVGSENGQLVTGARTRWSESTSVYAEQRYMHGTQRSGLIQTYGLDFAPNDRWRYGLSTDIGRINSESSHEIRREAISGRVGYRSENVRYGGALEFRRDRSDEEERKLWLLRNNLGYQVNPDWRMLGVYNMAISDSSRGSFFDGNFVEASLGYAYRPVLNDRWNTLFKYTYLSDLAPPEQERAVGNRIDYSQRSHVLALDVNFDVTPRFTLGGRYAYRYGQLRMGRDDSAEWFDSRGQLIAVRGDWEVIRKWDLMGELRQRDEFTSETTYRGALAGVYRHFGNHFKAGVGYNFADFSDDLTDMDFRTQGWFINLVGHY